MTDIVLVKNYTTSIKAEKTISEIEQILVKFNAQGIYKEYQGQRVSSIMFFIVKDNQKIPFKLPMSLEKSRTVVVKAVNAGKLPQRFLNEPLRTEQGERVAWRVLKDWIHSQLSLIEIELVDAIQIFLPFVYDTVQDKTLYQKFIEKKEQFIALEDVGDKE